MTDAAQPSSEDLFEHAACGLLVTAVDGRIRRANALLCRWLGFAHEELVGQRLQALFTLAGRLLHEEHWGPLLQRRGAVTGVRLELRHRDGRSVPLLMNARASPLGTEPLHELAVMRVSDRGEDDVALQHARRQAARREGARRAIEEGQQVLGLAIRGARMGAWSRDLATNQVWWSPELEELMGLPPGGFGGNEAAFLELVHEADRAALDRAIAAATRTVILLDIGLPQLNGYEVARRLRAQPWGRDIRLVAVTGWGQAQDKRAAFDAGFDHHLTKPVELPELEGLIALGVPVGR